MRDTPIPERPGAASPSPPPLQAAGRRTGEGAASVLEYLVQDRLRHSHSNPPPKEHRM